jgi:hypothetical protein
MYQNEFPLDPHHIGVPLVAPKMIFEPMVRSVQTVHLSCVKINTISKQTKSNFHFTHVTMELHRVRPKAIGMPMVHSAQTVHLSYVEINTILKWTEM